MSKLLNKIININNLKFNDVRDLRLPLGHYAITGSGPLGIRGIRPIGDVDVVVDDTLWAWLTRRYRPTRDDGFWRLRIGPHIEVFGEDSILASRSVPPTVTEQLARAQVIRGLPFICLEHSLHFKRRVLNRPKDQADIRVIETLLARERYVHRHPATA